MKRFTFSLEKLLSLREFKEKEAEIALGKANSRCEVIRTRLETLAHDRITASRSRRPGSDIAELRSIEMYIRLLDKKKEETLTELAEAELVLEKARAVYIEAHRDREVLSRLRDKKTAVWRKDLLDTEAAVLDDINNARELRKSGDIST